MAETGIDALAVCIGNVHGHYASVPRLDLVRLAAIRKQVAVPLVLHGASGLPTEMIREAVAGGICKFNVNTELREALVGALRVSLSMQPGIDLIPLMEAGIRAMQAVAVQKIEMFGSSGKA